MESLLFTCQIRISSGTNSFRYYMWVVFWHQSIPYHSLRPLGPFTQYLLDHHYHTLLYNGYWLAWLIHMGQSLNVTVLCKSKTITNACTQLLLFLQTFLFGIASLSIFIAYRPKHQNLSNFHFSHHQER
uniref:Transmembrane protein 254 n=1 Tax=Felis catus TaxID=9685 RepID=A0ABI7WD60_FELCA